MQDEIRLETTGDIQLQFNRNAALFSHNLTDLNALSFSSIKSAVLRMPESQIYASQSTVDESANLDDAHKIHGLDCTLRQALDKMETSNAFIMVRSPESDPVLAGVFEGLQAEVRRFLSDRQERLANATLYLFLTSPGGMTPYHIDRYSTFLFQLQGTKTVSTWKPWESNMIPPNELESFYSYKHTEAPTYRAEFTETEQQHRLMPGQVLHIPFLAPHLVRNGPDVSVSVSIIFNTRRTEHLGQAMQFNHWLRSRLGWLPDEVNGSYYRDVIKAQGYRALRRISALKNQA